MQDLRYKLVQKMPAIKWQNKTIYKKGSNQDIQTALLKQIPEAVRQVKPIAESFRGKTDLETLKNIHSFIRKNLGYRRDPKGFQQIKLPNRFLIESGDCKSNSLFIFALCKALNIPCEFKFANYQAWRGLKPSHVYNIAFDKKNNTFVCIDGTSSKFGYEKKPYFARKTNFMQVQTLSDNADGISGKKKVQRQEKRAEKKAW